MATEIVIIPILNKRVSLIQGPPILLSDDFYIEKISDEEHSAFFRNASERLKADINLKTTKCIKIKAENPTDKEIKKYRIISVFTLNILSEKYPIVTSWAGHLHGEKKILLKSITEFESLAALHKISNNEYKLSEKIKRQSIISIFDVVNKAFKSNESVLFTLEKYNSSLLRDDFFDKLLDAAICFETMTPGNTELIFRLSQNIAFIVGETPTERLTIFNSMKLLYDVRSKFVHGDIQAKGADKKIEDVKSKWETYEKYLKSSVLYYLIFLSEHKKDDWENHLKEIVLGTQNKIA